MISPMLSIDSADTMSKGCANAQNGGVAMRRGPLVCWIVLSSVPYHDARLKAAVEAGELEVCMVQITDMENFRVLRQKRESSIFSRYTLFPETPLHQIGGWEMVRRLHTCLSRIRPSVVCINGWSHGGGLAALQWCLSQGIPVIVMSDSTAIDAKRHWWLEAVKKRIVKLCSAALVAGTPQRNYVEFLGARSDCIFAGYDAVDNEHFRAGADAARRQEKVLRRALGLPDKYFMACARFVSKKNLAGLLLAYALYRRLHGAGAWPLVVIGDGELKPELLALRHQLGIDDDVLFPGPKHYDELPAYYGLAGAFVHASTTEQWGLVVNEAMASGLPVLVSKRCGCAIDLVEEGRNGFLFDPCDNASLAAAMHRIARIGPTLDDMGRTSLRIIARWSPENFARNLARAAQTALLVTPPRPTIFDRLLLGLLSTR